MDIPFLDDEQVAALTPWPELVDALRDAFRGDGEAPTRHHHEIPGVDRDDITMLIMPAWNPAGDFGVKLANVVRSNDALGLPTLYGLYMLFDGRTGKPQAILDAGALTARRTAAASALASRSLSREDSRVLLVIGTGRVAGELVAAHCSVRPIEEVRIWGRNPEHAREAANRAKSACGVACVSVPDIQAAAADADIITSATPAEEPLLLGEWITSGTHVDLVGAFKPIMCEADPALISKADQVFVDTVEDALEEAGDLIQAAEAGSFSFDDVAGDLRRIASVQHSLRNSPDEITVFKSVGSALEDLAAAQLCLRMRAG
ncbi:MAG: ornithine cyclodeaminase family protein [Xanthomonadales bacterium]|nr:ornithine cyclodeaminase family protein [Xanthomonadales bacterium]